MLNERYLTVLLVVLAILAVIFLPGAPIAAAEILTLKLIYVAFLMLTALAFIHFLRGTRYDVFNEIFEQENMAVSLFVSAMVVSIALVIGK